MSGKSIHQEQASGLFGTILFTIKIWSQNRCLRLIAHRKNAEHPTLVIANIHKRLSALRVPLLCLLPLIPWFASAAPPSGPANISCSALENSEDIANINELAFSGNSSSVEFIEVKILSSSQTPIDISGWELRFSKNGGTPVVVELGQGNGTWNTSGRDDNDGPDSANPTSFPDITWLIYPFASLVASQGEVLLVDSAGNALDYLRYYNSNDNSQYWQVPAACGGNNVVARNNSNDKDFARLPDGSGDWSNNGDDPSDGETNDDTPSGPDHYAINYSATTASGIACAGLTITLAAHDSAHNEVDALQATVALTTSSNRGSWSGTGVTDNTTGDGAANLTFGLGTTSTTAVLSYPDLNGLDSDTFIIGASDGSVSQVSGSAAAGDGLQVTFALAGFRFINDSVSPASTTLPHQVAGQNSGGQEIVLQAIRTDTTTGECASVYSDGSTVQIELAAEYIDPSTGAGQAVAINGGVINTYNDNATAGVSGGYTSVNLTFGTDSKTALTLNYPDVGQIQLHATDNVILPAGIPATLTGSSNSFVVRPYQFVVTTVESNDATPIANPGTTISTAAGNGFIAAGTAFRIVVEARNFNGDPTPNYGNENIAEGIALPTVPTLVFPVGAGANNGVLANNNDFAATGNSGEFANTTVNWNEVGTFTVAPDVADGDYLGTGVGVAEPLQSANIGRFYPAGFAMVNTSGENTVNYVCGTFAYLSAPNLQFNYTLQALNAGGNLVVNYDNTQLNYGEPPDLNDPPNIAEIDYHAENNNDGNDLGNRIQLNTNPTWDDGRYEVDTTALFNRSASGLEGPYNDLIFSLTVTEPDGSTLLASSLNENPGGTLDCRTQSPSTCTAAAIGYDESTNQFTQAVLRFGRAVIKSTHGPESTVLPVTFGSEYWNGSQFVTNSDDYCTAIPLAQISFNGLANTIDMAANRTVALNGGSTTGSLNISGTDTLASGGSFGLIFSAPQPGTGSFPVDVTLTGLAWLLYDWNQDGAHNENPPRATISFGSYRGHDRVIYWRERFD